MNCKCGVPAFFFTSIKKDFKYEISKCGSFTSDLKNKMKCNFKKETKTKYDCAQAPFISLKYEKIEESFSLSFEKEIKKEISLFIFLLENSKNNLGMSRDNYISNINYNLRKLNFPLFFVKNESIESLKSRLSNEYVKNSKRKSEYPFKIIDVPENLRYKRFKKVTSVSKVKNSSTPFKGMVNYSNSKILNKFKNLEIMSETDESMEEDSLEDNTFDIDDYESDLEDDSKNIYWEED